jgi:hypothetical protein
MYIIYVEQMTASYYLAKSIFREVEWWRTSLNMQILYDDNK